MSIFKISIILSILFGLFSIMEIGVGTYASIIDILALISIVMVSTFFILYVKQTYLNKTDTYYLYSIIILIIIIFIILNNFSYYRISQNITTSLLLINIYSLFYILIDKALKSKIIKKAMVFIMSTIFIGGIYYYVDKIVKKNFNYNEAIKKIYIEVGAVIEREKIYKTLTTIKDCNKFKELQKRLIKLDNELKNDKFFKSVYDKYKNIK